LQAAQLGQWDDTYSTYVQDPANAASWKPSTDVLVVGSDNSATLSGVVLKKPFFANDNLQWTTADGNSTNGNIKFQLNNTATTAFPFTGKQFYGRQWGPG
jgi:hypothetical protein